MCPCPPPRHLTTCERVRALRADEDRIAEIASLAHNARLSMLAARRALMAGDETQAQVSLAEAQVGLALLQKAVQS